MPELTSHLPGSIMIVLPGTAAASAADMLSNALPGPTWSTCNSHNGCMLDTTDDSFCHMLMSPPHEGRLALSAAAVLKLATQPLLLPLLH